MRAKTRKILRKIGRSESSRCINKKSAIKTINCTELTMKT